MIVLYIFLSLVALILLLLSLPVTVIAGYNEKFYFKLYYFLFKLNSEKANKKQKTKKTKTKIKSKKNLFGYFKELFSNEPLPDAIAELCKYVKIIVEKLAVILRRSSMRHFNLKITESNSEAATAAINYGTICATVYPFLGFLNSVIPFNQQNVEINCDYTGENSEFKFDLKWRLIPLFCISPLISMLFEFIKEKGR